ncbi:hypothetical protein K1719_022895 [Acacia pycnantha]|nr:hypothetical protein K1719_022895 [Acacia pycnantha]
MIPQPKIQVVSGGSSRAPASSSGDIGDDGIDHNRASTTNSSKESNTKWDEEEQETDENVVGSTSLIKTFLNCLNALSGVGIVSIPYALAAGGWLSLILLFVIASTTFYSGVLIKKCMEKNLGIKTYPDIGYRAFGGKGRLAVSITIGLSLGGKKLFVILIGLIIMPSVWIDNLNFLSYISASGVLASVIIIGSISATAVDGVGFNHRGTLINWKGIPTAVSLYAFCYGTHPLFPSLYNSTRKKAQFSNVLLICFVLSTFGYASMAIVGYLMYGSNVQSRITLDLPVNRVTSKVAISLDNQFSLSCHVCSFLWVSYVFSWSSYGRHSFISTSMLVLLKDLWDI